MQFDKQIEFIREYYGAPAHTGDSYIKIALTLQAMVVALDLKDGDLVVTGRELESAVNAGISTVSRAALYAKDILCILDSGTGRNF